MVEFFSRRGVAVGAVAAALSICVPAGARAHVKWDVSLPWGPTEFHTLDAERFATEVKDATNGQVILTIHPGGALGVRANESVRAVEDGAVPMAEYAAFQNVGEVPLLGIESLPFLVDDYEQLKVLHQFVRPAWEAALAKRNQKVLYVVPWPSQNFFLNRPVKTLDDLKGVRMRTYDKVTAEMVSKLGMVPLQMNNPDIVPALASGKLDAVMTSGTTAVAQKYWEFLKYAYNTNHLWASNLMAVNLDSWKELKPEQQQAIEKVAKRLEPEFWEVSKGEHAKRMAELASHGMKVEPPSAELIAAMKRVTRPIVEDYIKHNPQAGKLIAAYREKIGK
jgi:TRAP-type C4-dicarboxylate transport system substrate-binding protein